RHSLPRAVMRVVMATGQSEGGGGVASQSLVEASGRLSLSYRRESARAIERKGETSTGRKSGK
ncbi:hypothetical protein TNCT_518271, partial [Trichonephila clavata]